LTDRRHFLFGVEDFDVHVRFAFNAIPVIHKVLLHFPVGWEAAQGVRCDRYQNEDVSHAA
jgi:hypothetical protein